ncbi:hypothetical protein NDA18_003517 [Ustilago nuda]|nr:hypothetical protein NDA18_003517 [Ustilago nuda]
MAAPAPSPPQAVAAVPPPPTTSTPPAALPAHIGEFQPAVSYPWLPPELVDRVHNNSLSIYELPKLANPSWPGVSAQTEVEMVVIEGVSVVKALTTSASSRQFVKAVPNFSTFSRLWIVYLTLRASSSCDPDLPVSLGRFYQHITNLSDIFHWDRVAGYVIAVCTTWLGRAFVMGLNAQEAGGSLVHMEGA